MAPSRDYPKLLTADIQAALHDRDLGEAVRLFEPVAREAEESGDPLALWAELMDELVHTGYAWPDWAEHWPGGDASLSRAVYFLVVGIHALQDEAYERAGYYLNRAAEAAPDSPVPLAYHGILHENLGCPSEALTYYRRCLELDPDLFSILNASGNLYHELGFYEEAVAMYMRAAPLLSEPSNQAILLANLGNSQRALGLLDEAIATYTEAIALDPAQPNTPLFLAETLLEARASDEAVACLTDVVMTPFFDGWPPESRKSCYRLLARAHTMAEAYPAAAVFWWLHLGGQIDEDDKEGLSALLKALFGWAIKRPGEAAGEHLLARINRYLGNLDAALLHAKRAVKLAVDRPDHFVELGASLLLNDKRPVALEAFDEALAMAPDRADIHVYRALALWPDDPRGAEAALKEAARLEPCQALHRCDLAWLYLAEDDLPKARQGFEQALLLWDRAPILYGRHGPAAQRGCYCDVIDPSLQENANSPNAGLHLLTAANYLVLANRREPARKALHRLLSEQPENIDALRNYAWLLGHQGWTAEALSIWRRILVLDPDDHISRFLALRTQANESSEGKLAALATLERVLGNRSDDHLARLLFAKLLEPGAEALAHFETLSTRLPEFYSPWYWLGQAHFMRREMEAARPPLERAIALNPAFSPARQMLAQCYRQLGDEARSHLHMGAYWLLQGKYHQARERYEEALAYDAEMGEALDGLKRVDRRLRAMDAPQPSDVTRLIAPRYRIR